MTEVRLTAADVRRVCGVLPAATVQEILAAGADLEALEEAAAWAASDDEHTPARHLPPESPAGKIYEILAASDEFEEELRNRS